MNNIILCHFAGYSQVKTVSGKCETRNPFGRSVMTS